MAVLIEQGPVCDGYDARVTLASGAIHVFHFLAAPENVQTEVDALETALLAAAEAQWEIETEIGSIV